MAGSCTKCGNKKIDYDEGETCDDGGYVNGDGCNSQCQIEVVATCGNGRLDSGEQCDDNNNRNGDGCNANCFKESGFVCTVGPNGRSQCSFCGNGILNSGEICDDGDTDPDDGCFQCRVEKGWDCTKASPSVCTKLPTLFCGDGIFSPENNEICDDGDTINSNGCTRSCDKTPGWECVSVPGTKSVCSLIPIVGASAGMLCLRSARAVTMGILSTVMVATTSAGLRGLWATLVPIRWGRSLSAPRL